MCRDEERDSGLVSTFLLSGKLQGPEVLQKANADTTISTQPLFARAPPQKKALVGCVKVSIYARTPSFSLQRHLKVLARANS